MTNPILPFAEALATVVAHAKALPPPASEAIALEAADNRILAAPVIAPRDQPPFDRSTRDGFAIGGMVDAADSEIQHPYSRRVVGTIKAGESWRGKPLERDTAIEIMTGAPVPEGTQAVVMVERTQVSGDNLLVEAGHILKLGDNIVPRGAEARIGDTLLSPGRILHAAEIAVAASCGAATLKVFRQPTVAILATGDELVELDATVPLALSAIYNSNSYALASLVRATGGIPARLPIARDTRADLDARLAAAAQYDLLLLSGGVSMGKYDLVEDALAALGAEFFFTGALIQPGKPVVFGKLPGTPEKSGPYFFGLPGNPVSTQVCFHLFVAPLLRALAGGNALEPTFVEARLEHDVPAGPKVLRFLPAELTGTADAVTVRLVGWQGSGDVSANARGNAYCVLPIATSLAQGDTVRVLLR